MNRARREHEEQAELRRILAEWDLLEGSIGISLCSDYQLD